MPETLLSVDAVAEQLGVTSQTVWRLIRRGELPAVRVGRLYRIAPTELRSWLESQATTVGVS